MEPRLEISSYSAVADLLEDVGLSMPPQHFSERYNVPPLTPVWAIYSRFGKAHLTPAEWALIPLWAKPGQFPRPLTVARVETLWERASYKNLARRYRALIPVNGFYVSSSRRSVQHVWHVRDEQRGAMALGALYQYNADGNMQISLITVPRSEALPDINDRHPLVVPSPSFTSWLNSDRQSEIESMLEYRPKTLVAQRVSEAVNDRNFDHPDCIAPLSEE